VSHPERPGGGEAVVRERQQVREVGCEGKEREVAGV